MPKIKYGIPGVTKKLDSNYVPYPKTILGGHSQFFVYQVPKYHFYHFISLVNFTNLSPFQNKIPFAITYYVASLAQLLALLAFHTSLYM